MSYLMREQHAEALQLGLPCPFDCAACETAANRHDHVCPTCATADGPCYSDECLYADDTTWDADRRAVTECRACLTGRVLGAVVLTARPALCIDWTGAVVREVDAAAAAAAADLIPF